jgi:signal transduction histidine kinase
MQPQNYHPLLAQQVNETLKRDAAGIPASMQPLLLRISETYGTFDAGQKRLEASVRLKSEQLVASTSRAYSFLDSLNMGLIMCDINPEVVFTNLSVRHILASKAGIIGREQPPAAAEANAWTLDAINRLLQPEIQLRSLILQSLTSAQPSEHGAVQFGKHVLRLFIAPMINEVTQGNNQNIGAVVLVEDVTEQEVLERSKDEFFFIASHELRTPLTAIRGNASLIKHYYAKTLPNKDVVEMIEDIHESAVRLIGIVNDFLDVSALEQGKIHMDPEPFLVSEVTQSVVRDLQSLSDTKSLALLVDPGVTAAPAVTADKQRIKQVIYNLLGNAIKFTDAGHITISTRQDNSFVYISIADTGRGMPAEAQRLLFRKFQQAGSSLLTRDTTNGTGLGLYISKLIIEQSGGRIGLEHSEVGKGSSFIFSLPRSKT